MKRFMYIAGILLVAMAVLFVSCNNEAAHTTLNDNGTVDLKMAIHVEGQDKALSYSDHYETGFLVTGYEYTAECTTTPGAQGTQESWASLTVTQGIATLQKMARGSWTIGVRAKNSAGGVISQGSVNVVLTSNGQDVSINLKNFNGSTSATVSVGVTVPILAAGSVEVKYIGLADMASLASQGTSVAMTPHSGHKTTVSGTGVVATTEAGGQNGYTGSASIAPGLYVMQILYKDGGTAVAGQMLAFRVADNTPFAINGTLTAGEFLDLDITPITADDRTVNVQLTQAAVSSGVLTCTATATVTSGTLTSPVYSWYVDGVLVGDQTSSTFNKSGYSSSSGTHVLTCIVSGTINGQVVVGYASSEYEAIPEPEPVAVPKSVGGKIFYIDSTADGTYSFKNGQGEDVEAPTVGTDCTDWTYTVTGATKDKYYVTDLTNKTYLNRTYDQGYHIVWSLAELYSHEDLSDYADEFDVIGLAEEDGDCTYEVENPESTIGNGRRNTEFILENRNDVYEYFPKTLVPGEWDFHYTDADLDEYPDERAVANAISVWECAVEANNAKTNGCDDWYVPSIGELIELRNANGTNTEWLAKVARDHTEYAWWNVNQRCATTWSSSAYGDEDVMSHSWTDGILTEYSWVIDVDQYNDKIAYDTGYRTPPTDAGLWWNENNQGEEDTANLDYEDDRGCILIRSF